MLDKRFQTVNLTKVPSDILILAKKDVEYLNHY